jgi:hypothetical protein
MARFEYFGESWDAMSEGSGYGLKPGPHLLRPGMWRVRFRRIAEGERARVFEGYLSHRDPDAANAFELVHALGEALVHGCLQDHGDSGLSVSELAALSGIPVDLVTRHVRANPRIRVHTRPESDEVDRYTAN